MSGNGWCTHPDRQVSSDVRILVRKAELACRNAWGSDLWEDKSSPEAPAARGGNTQPASVPPPSFTLPVSYDDEVTSVVNTDQHQAVHPSTLDDEVVDQSIISFTEDDYDAEQDERRDLLYRDSRSAIERARQRSLQRRQQPLVEHVTIARDEDTVDVDADDDVVIAEGEESPESIAASLKAPVFEPEDYIEEEAPSAPSSVDEHDDALLSEGIRTLSPREARLRRFRDERPRPKAQTVTKIEPEPDDVELVLPPSAAPERGRFDSIPEISADIDLPLLRRSSSATTQPARTEQAAAATSKEDAPPPSAYDQALKRAHALHAANRAEQNIQRRHATPPPMTVTAEREPAPVASMPDLPDDPEVTASPSSPAQAQRPPLRLKRTRPEEPPQPVTVERARPRTAAMRPESAAGDPRRSWWRGQLGVQESVTQDAPGLIASASSSTFRDAEPEPVQMDVESIPEPPVEMPSRVSFDLERQDDLESFRDRLFASSTSGDQPETAPQRSPIRVSRPAQRQMSPDAREGTRARRRPAAQQHRAPVEEPDAPRRETRPERQERPERAVQAVAEERQPSRQVSRQPSRQPTQHELRQQLRQRHIEPADLLEAPEDAWYEPESLPDFDVRTLIAANTELLDMTIDIAPDVPRECVTCRNYRPSEQPGRGWCTNAWAFTHRQMVNETDLACDSTIGCWWLPADEEVWLEDVSIAQDATPRIDRLIAHLNPERRAVGN